MNPAGSLSDALSPREGLDPSGYKGACAPAGRDDPRVKIVVFVLVPGRRMLWVFALAGRVFRDFSCGLWGFLGVVFGIRTMRGDQSSQDIPLMGNQTPSCWGVLGFLGSRCVCVRKGECTLAQVLIVREEKMFYLEWVVKYTCFQSFIASMMFERKFLQILFQSNTFI